MLQSQAHLVELDLLRGGERLPIIGTRPLADYWVIVSRRQRRPLADLYAWSMCERLPVIPVPLRKGDLDAPLDLQAVFDQVYDRARYDLSLD